MKTLDLFKNQRSAKKINESIEKIFGKKINLESFNLEQLQDARNKLRTQLHDARSQSGFNENIENEAVTQAQWMLDAINAEIAERAEYVVDTSVEEQTLDQMSDEELADYIGADADWVAANREEAEEVANDMSDDYGAGETDDNYALTSAGFGSDEDYGDYGDEYESIEEKGDPKKYTEKQNKGDQTPTDPVVVDLFKKARMAAPQASTDQEAVYHLIAKQTSGLDQQVDRLQAQNKRQAAAIDQLDRENRDQANQLTNMTKDAAEKEERFKELTAKIAAQGGQASAQDIAAAKAAKEIEREQEPKVAASQQALQRVAQRAQRPTLATAESIGKPKLSRIHYFQVPANDQDLAAQAGLKQDKGGNWVLYQFDKSGVPFNQTFAKAVNMFGRPKSISVSEQTMTPIKKVDIPAVMRKKSGDANWKVTQQDLEKDKEQTATTAQGIAAKKKQLGIDTDTMEVAPPGAKAERMVKHIKKGYAKDGKLSDKEKSIAYATAWKQHNKSKNESQQVDELSRDTIKSYAEKKKEVITKNPPTTKQAVGKDLKGVKGALERLRGIKPTSESTELGESMKKLTEGEIQQASAIVTAKTMVDRVGRWIEELSGMENDTLLQLGDSIRDEMGSEQAKNFISAVAPAIQAALENLKQTRETLSTGVRSLTGEEQPAEMLGGEEGDMAPTAGDEMNMPAEEPDAAPEDEFAAAEPAAGVGDQGREQRESIDYQNRLLKVLAG